jgi:hypothetical protein
LRNPWRFSFDRRTGDLTIGDVGQSEQEEIDFVARDRGRGANFGWRPFEGRARYAPGESAAGHVPPVFVGTHAEGWCSVTGGIVARDRALGPYYGRYLFADFCKEQIFSAQLRAPRARSVRRPRCAPPSVSPSARTRAARVRRLADGPGLPDHGPDEPGGARASRGCARTTRGPLTLSGTNTWVIGPRSGVGDRSRVRCSTSTCEPSSPRWSAAAARAASR